MFGMTNTCLMYSLSFFYSSLKQDGPSSLFPFNCDLLQHLSIIFVLPSPVHRRCHLRKESMSTVFPNFRLMYSNVFALLLITLFIFKYSLSLHDNFTDSISNISLIIPVVFSLTLRPDEELHNLAVRLECGQC